MRYAQVDKSNALEHTTTEAGKASKASNWKLWYAVACLSTIFDKMAGGHIVYLQTVAAYVALKPKS